MSRTIDRRTALVCFSGLLLLTTSEHALAQSVTDRERTKWLRDGIGPTRARTPRSSLPPTPIRVHDRLDRELSIGIDPDRSVDMNIRFGFDSAELEPRAVGALAWLGRALRGDLAGRGFLLAGHTDASGSREHNLALSFARARSVRDHLVTVWGVDPDLLYVAGFGSDHLRDGSDPTSAINRRVEIVAVREILR